MTDEECQAARVREGCLQWAMQTAAPGEDAMAIIARAQLYEDYLLPMGLKHLRLGDGEPKLG